MARDPAIDAAWAWLRRSHELRDAGVRRAIGVYCCPANLTGPCREHEREPFSARIEAHGLTPIAAIVRCEFPGLGMEPSEGAARGVVVG